MEFVDTRKWGSRQQPTLSFGYVSELCLKGLIPGARRSSNGATWEVPVDARRIEPEFKHDEETRAYWRDMQRKSRERRADGGE